MFIDCELYKICPPPEERNVRLDVLIALKTLRSYGASIAGLAVVPINIRLLTGLAHHFPGTSEISRA